MFHGQSIQNHFFLVLYKYNALSLSFSTIEGEAQFAEMSSRDGKEERRVGDQKQSVGAIFRYADWVDVLLMFLGTIGAIGDGMSTNCLLVFASSLMNSLGNGKVHENFMDNVEKVSG